MKVNLYQSADQVWVVAFCFGNTPTVIGGYVVFIDVMNTWSHQSLSEKQGICHQRIRQRTRRSKCARQ